MNKKLIPLLILPTVLLSACNLLSPFGDDESEFVPVSNSSSEQPVEVEFAITKAKFTDEEGHLKVNYTCNFASPFAVPNHEFNKLNVTGVTISEVDYSNAGYFTLLSPVINSTLKFEFYDKNNAVYISLRYDIVIMYSKDDPTEEVDYPTGYTTLYWSDEFNGESLDTSKWTYETGNGSGGWGNDEIQYYTNQNDFIDNGALTIRAKRQEMGGFHFTSTRIKTQNKVKFIYGYVEARILLPADTGMWPAFWMMPNNSVYGGWPHSGEIDIMEAKGRLPYQSSSAIHYSTLGGGHTYLTHEQYGHTIYEYHKYAVEWLEDTISFYIDDVCHATYGKAEWTTSGAPSSDTAPFDKDFYIILNLAIGGHFDGYREPDESFDYADMKIDYVRVFKK